MPSLPRIVALVSAPVFLLAACGSDPTSLNDVKVNNSKPSAPTLSLAKGKLPLKSKKSTTKVLKSGSGTTIDSNSLVNTNFIMLDGRTGKTVGSTFGQASNQALDMSNLTKAPDLVKALKGQKNGAELMTTLPASELVGSSGDTTDDVKASDTLVMYFKVNNVGSQVSSVQGKTQTPPSDMPKVSVPSGTGKQATITVPKGAKAPTSLKTSTLVEGTGATIKAGQTIKVTYTGQIWGTSKIFDSTQKEGGKPASFVIGRGQVIPGWDKALVGAKVGSRLLIVVPPAQGYGKSGNPQAGIKGTDTLIFVVDVLGAA